MIRYIAITILFSYSAHSFGGVVTELYTATVEKCVKEVSHSAAVGSTTGTILFSSFEIIDGVQWACEASANTVAKVLSKGLSEYKNKKNLVPITSVRIGHLQYYKWIKIIMEEKSKSGQYERLNFEEFNKFVRSESISAPFGKALEENGFNLENAECEKRIYFDNGAPRDAFCWLSIKST
jgi:hypothetical protein